MQCLVAARPTRTARLVEVYGMHGTKVALSLALRICSSEFVVLMSPTLIARHEDGGKRAALRFELSTATLTPDASIATRNKSVRGRARYRVSTDRCSGPDLGSNFDPRRAF